MATITESEKDPALLLSCYGTKAFVKIYQALEIDRIKFSFVTKGREKDSIDIYMSAEEFQADLIAQIVNKELERKRVLEITRVRETGDKKYRSIWESRAGKSSKNTIRKFSIQPGQNMEYVFFATESSESGKENSKYILVGCAAKDLTLLAFRWSFLYEDYKKVLQTRYSMEKMKSTYNHSREAAVDSDMPYNDFTQNQQPSPASATKASGSKDGTWKQTQGDPAKSKHFSVGSKDIRSDASQGNSGNGQGKNTGDVQKTGCEVKSFKLKIKTPITSMKSGKYALEGYTENNQRHIVVFNPAKFSNWEKFYQICLNPGNMICFKGIATEDRIIATEII